MVGWFFILVFSFVFGSVAVWAASAPLHHVDQILVIDGKRHTVRVPEGFRLELLTRKLDGPRLMAFAANGDLVIGSKSGRVYRLAPPYSSPNVLIRLDDYPHSVAFRKGEIFIARTHGLYRAPYRPGQPRLSPETLKRVLPLPGGGGHDSRTVAVGPDGRVYVSLGIQGNCSDQYLDNPYPFEERRGGILALQEQNGPIHWEPYGTGLRNPVGFAWHPVTHALYASNNGPDHLGFDQPPEYFSQILPGSFHGMPWFQFDGKKILRDTCAQSTPPRAQSDVRVPVATFPARNAPMGVDFVPKGALKPTLEYNAIVALRGSWGTRPSGSALGDPATRRPPKLVVVRFENGVAERVDDLITGFQLPNGDRWARPVGVAIGPDGALYFTSDSHTHGLFRLRAK